MKITVIGSSNIDMISNVRLLPGAGETVLGGRFMQAYGGKGANQAVAASRLGADVTFISAVGDDSFGTEQIRHFVSEGMSTDGISTIKGEHSGVALIMVDSNGENSISVCPGANAALDVDLLESHRNMIQDADVVLMQGEIPYATVKHAARIARDAGASVIYNPAPVGLVDSGMYAMTDVMILNQTEASQLTGISDDYKTAAETIRSRGVNTVIVTLGTEGSYALTQEDEYFVPSFKVKAVDTVGAGDTYCGAIAVEYAHHKNLNRDSLEFASAASALSVTKHGAQPSIPFREDVLDFLSKQK